MGGVEDGGDEYMRGKDRTISSARASIKGLIREVAKKKKKKILGGRLTETKEVNKRLLGSNQNLA